MGSLWDPSLMGTMTIALVHLRTAPLMRSSAGTHKTRSAQKSRAAATTACSLDLDSELGLLSPERNYSCGNPVEAALIISSRRRLLKGRQITRRFCAVYLGEGGSR